MTALQVTVNRVTAEIFARYRVSLITGTLEPRDVATLILIRGFAEINAAFCADDNATMADVELILYEGVTASMAELGIDVPKGTKLL